MKYFVFLLIAAEIATAQVSLPTDPGLYVENGGSFTKVIGQIAQFTRTGSRFASTATIGIKSAKANIQLQGPHAQTIVSPQPTFYFIPPKQAAEAGVNAGDLILIRLEEKTQRRQFEIAAAGLFRASAGISLTHQIQLIRSEPKPGVYEVTPAVELPKGEYALYLARGEGMAAYVYDFGVGGRAAQTLRAPSAPQTIVVDDHRQPSSSNPTGSATPASVSQARSVAAPSRGGGSLGIFGADWEEQGTRGVQILKVLQDSSADLAGLHVGDIITDVNGMRVDSTQKLSDILSKIEPGTRVNIGYIYKSNIGFMPKSATAILSREQ